ncbi:MAG TPA: hypothetical protein VJ453_02910 [Terriglobales bacterium]|jgi:hypothetical protein|nr:hypothetical protein [Terriglobales bacterium]
MPTWFSDHSTVVTTLINYIPVVATVVTCIFSLVLTRATLRQVEATDKGLALAREEFEREWAPELHIKLRRESATEVEIVVTNLAKASVLLEVMQFRNMTGNRPFERCVLNDPLIGGMTWTESIGDRLRMMTGQEFDGVVDVAITFFAAGRMYRTDWFRFNVLVHNGHILRVEAVTLPARRVRVAHGREHQVELEPVRDASEPESKSTNA